MAPEILHFDYEFSPYGQKIKLLLEATGVDFKRVDAPIVLPRNDLEALGITYRRIPVLAVGKDVYCDSALMIDLILDKLAKKNIPQSPADKAWEAYGYETFIGILQLAPFEFLTPDFIKDRETIFPVLARGDYKLMRQSGIAELQSRMSFIESLLANQPYIGGDKLSVADIHVIFGIRWGLRDLGNEKESLLGKDAFPKVWKLIESLPECKPQTISGEDAIKIIKEGEYTAKSEGIEEGDPLGYSAGTPVTVESTDSAEGSHPQAGKLLSTSRHEVVLELENGIHLHFPRAGYVVKKA